MLTGKNDAITTLAAKLAAGASSCTVTDASKLPATFPYRLRIWDWATYRQPADDAGEIVEVTNAVGNVLTITRAQEGTADVLHAAGETCANTITWAYVDEMQSAIAARALAGAVTASGLTMATGKILGRATASTGAIEEIAVTGTGSVVLATSPTLTTPELGQAHATSLTCSSFMGTYSSGGAAQVTARAWTNTATDSGYISFYRRRGTEASPLDVKDGDRMGRIVWFGYDTDGTLRTVNGITVECQGGPTGSSVPSRMLFGPNPAAPRMAIYNDASIVLGTQSALATNATGGFVYIPTCAGMPTGTPTSYTGKSPLVYNSVTHSLMAYNASGWRSITELDTSLSADGQYRGWVVAGTAGATLAFGDLVYLDPTDSRWELADANSASGADGDPRGMLGLCVLAAANDGSATKVLLWGFVRADAAFPSLTVNAPAYVSETAGDVTGTAPTTTDSVTRVVGFGVNANLLYFCPSADYITHT